MFPRFDHITLLTELMGVIERGNSINISPLTGRNLHDELQFVARFVRARDKSEPLLSPRDRHHPKTETHVAMVRCIPVTT